MLFPRSGRPQEAPWKGAKNSTLVIKFRNSKYEARNIRILDLPFDWAQCGGELVEPFRISCFGFITLFRIPNSKFHLPHSDFRIPTSPFQIPNSPFPLPNSILFPFEHRFAFLQKGGKPFDTILGFSDNGTALLFYLKPLFEAFIFSGGNRI